MDTSDRIFKLLDELEMEQKQFAALLGVSDDKVSTWRVKRTRSYKNHLPQIAEVLGTTVQWLLTGEGEAQQSKKPTPETGDGPARNIVRVAGRDGSYIERTLTDEQVAAVRTIISQLPDADDL